MGRHPAIIKILSFKGPGLPGTDRPVQICRMNILQVGVTGHYFWVTEHLCYGGQHGGIRINIVGIEDTDHLAGGRDNSFVHSVINAFILLRYDFRNMGESGYQLQGIVLRLAVYYDMLDIRVVLPLNGAKGIFYCCGAVVSGCDDGDLHIALFMPMGEDKEKCND